MIKGGSLGGYVRRLFLFITILLIPVVGFSAGPEGKAEIAYSHGLLLYQKHQYAQAVEAFSEALQLNANHPSAGYFLDLARGKMTHKKPWRVYGSLSTAYDSNVTLDPTNLTVTSLPSDQRDAEVALKGGGSYKIIQKPQYQLFAEGFYYQSLHPTLSGFNYGLSHISLDNQFFHNNLSWTTPVAIEFSTLGSSKYLWNGIWAPTMGFLWAERWWTQVFVQGSYNYFFQPGLTNGNQYRRAWNLQPGIRQSVFIKDKSHYVSAAYNFEKNWAKGNDWDYKGHTIMLAARLPLVWKLDLDLYGTVSFGKNFDNVDSIVGIKRKDTLYMAGAKIYRKWMNFETGVYYNYSKNDSNVAFFTYDRSIVGASFGVSY